MAISCFDDYEGDLVADRQKQGNFADGHFRA